MKRIILYCILLAIALAVPIKKIDISDLEPIQVVRMDKQDNNIILQTDTGDQGLGENVQQALENLKQNSAGIIYLDTAEFLAVTENAKEYIGSMKAYLKGKVLVCQWDGEGELSAVGKYMKAHKIGVRLKQWWSEMNIPKLPQKIIEKNENNP